MSMMLTMPKTGAIHQASTTLQRLGLLDIYSGVRYHPIMRKSHEKLSEVTPPERCERRVNRLRMP